MLPPTPDVEGAELNRDCAEPEPDVRGSRRRQPGVAADCQTLFTFATEDMQSSEALSLQVGEEITDEHREQMDELISQLEEPRPANRPGAGRP